MSKMWDDRWGRYEVALKGASVPGRMRGPYRAWVEGFLKAIRPGKWWSTTASEVEGYLRELDGKGRPDWQRQQANEALRIFFQEAEPVPWASPWVDQRAAQNEKPPARPIGGFRDAGGVPSSRVGLFESIEATLTGHAYAVLTRRAYGAWLRRFLAFSGETRALSENLASEYLDYLGTERGVSDRSLRQAFNALRFLFSAVLKTDFRVAQPRALPPRRQPVFLTVKEVQALFPALPGGANYSLALLLWTTGLTLGEAVRLRIRQVDFARSAVVLEGRSGEIRSLPFPAQLEETIRLQIDNGRKLWEADRAQGVATTPGDWADSWLFPSGRLAFKEGVCRPHIHPQSFQQLLTRAAKRAGLAKAVTPHTLRHSFAVQSLRNGLDPVELQKLLGQADPGSTLMYARLAAEAAAV